MNDVLTRWNSLESDEAAAQILPCCGSHAWAQLLTKRRPICDEAALLTAADQIWSRLPESDWLEAFRSHPRIGESHTESPTNARSTAWSSEEQRRAQSAADSIKAALKDGNRAYEQRFNRIFIVCASGKSPQDILQVLHRRLANDEATELREAAEQQRQIAQLRLKKWLNI